MRWKMHKLGFLNFWLYDREEFVLDDGHILLRGDNASGKSITTQSFIPFILDGNRRPERLDPFGSRDRKMEFYLLGDREREDSTGYLYLEFRKPDVEEYRTIGVGMRAQLDKGITDFWGFCLKDGRRIGGGLSLCEEKENGTLLPLSHRKLKDRIPGNCWAESPEEYKAIVNREIFGFSDIREYDQLVQLLIKVRAPKLSKDMRPSEVKTILRDSLQVLTESDLSAMSAVMDRMDQMEDTLQDYEAAMRDIQIIRNEYTRYNQYMLGLKGRAYLDARRETLSCGKKLAEQRREQQAIQMRREQQSERRDEAKQKLDEAYARRAEMGEDTLSAKHNALEEHLRRCEECRNRADNLQAELSQLNIKIREQETACQVRRQQTETAGHGLRNAVRELESIHKILLLGEEHSRFVRVLEQADGRQTERIGPASGFAQEESGIGQAAGFVLTAGWGQTEGQVQREKSSLLMALGQRRKQIREVLKKYRELDPARSVYREAQSRLEEAEQAFRVRQETLRDAQEQEHQERARMTEDFALWRRENSRMVFLPEAWNELRIALENYQGPAWWGPIQRLADDCYRHHFNELQKEKQDTETALGLLEESLREKKRELDQILAQRDPVPPRREAVQAARTRLSMQSIPFAAFYETIDFAPDLPQAERNLLEAQLMDAGLLDALIVPESHAAALKDILAEYPDCFMLPGPAAEVPLTGLTAAEGPLRATADACLRSISGMDMEAETAILSDGRYRNGILCGHSHAEEEARFVGPEARRKYREQLIRQFQSVIEELSSQIRESGVRLDNLGKSLELLNREREQIPTADNWNQAIDMVREAEQDSQRAEADVENAQKKEREKYFALSSLEREIRERSQGLPYGQTMEDWEEAQDAAEDYQAAVSGADTGLTTLQAAMELETAAVNMLESSLRHREDKERSIRENQRDWNREQVQADTIQEELDRPENRERERRFQELNQSIKEWNEKNKNASDEIIRIDEQQKYLEESISQAVFGLERAEKKERLCGQYFSEELDLGLSDFHREDGLEVCAKGVVDAVPASAQDRMPEDMGDALRRNFLEHNNSLLKYYAENKLTFDPPEDPALPRQRLCITLRLEGKTLSLYEFADALQGKIDEVREVWASQDRKLFETILMDTISKKLRGRIDSSRDWVRRMTTLMSSLRTSMDLTFSLEWKERGAENEAELGTAELVKLLSRDAKLLSTEDSDRLTEHFLSRIKRLREEAKLRGELPNYTNLIHEALDYRNWYQFQIFYRRGEERRELTDRVFNQFSGGEKAMSMYVPLFASVSARYQKAREDAPLLLALDEAFAGVDEKNIAAMFGLLQTLHFDYIINSQVLWGCYSCVENLDIAELRRPDNASVVTIMRCHWNGLKRETEDEL